MSKARLIITAVIIEGRSQAAVARDYRVSQAWVSRLVARYRTEGDLAFEPRSRRPVTRPDATPADVVALVLEVRQRLTNEGLDAGADTIVWHLEHHHRIKLSRATIYRILRRANLIVAEPAKKPRSSYIRFEAEQPNETWQGDFTHWRLADGTDIEILTWLNDHSRYALSITAHQPVTGPAVVTTFQTATTRHGIPFSTLTDNAMVFTIRFAHGARTSRNALKTELARLHVRHKNSRPNHPTTCGKVERFQQTMKNRLRARPAAATIIELQTQLDTFAEIYNHHRPHRSLPHRATPAVARRVVLIAPPVSGGGAMEIRDSDSETFGAAASYAVWPDRPQTLDCRYSLDLPCCACQRSGRSEHSTSRRGLPLPHWWKAVTGSRAAAGVWHFTARVPTSRPRR